MSTVQACVTPPKQLLSNTLRFGTTIRVSMSYCYPYIGLRSWKRLIRHDGHKLYFLDNRDSYKNHKASLDLSSHDTQVISIFHTLQLCVPDISMQQIGSDSVFIITFAVDWSEIHQSITLIPIRWHIVVIKFQLAFPKSTNATSSRNILLYSMTEMHTRSCLSSCFLFSLMLIKVICAISINIYWRISHIAFKIIWHAKTHIKICNIPCLYCISNLPSLQIKAGSGIQMIDDTQPRPNSLFEFGRYIDKLIWFNCYKGVSWCLMDRG